MGSPNESGYDAGEVWRVGGITDAQRGALGEVWRVRGITDAQRGAFGKVWRVGGITDAQSVSSRLPHGTTKSSA